MPKCVIRFKDGNYCNLEADYIYVGEDGYIQVWNGEKRLVGVFRLAEIVAIYLTEKGAKQ